VSKLLLPDLLLVLLLLFLLLPLLAPLRLLLRQLLLSRFRALWGGGCCCCCWRLAKKALTARTADASFSMKFCRWEI
jgi:hypothetical protein